MLGAAAVTMQNSYDIRMSADNVKYVAVCLSVVNDYWQGVIFGERELCIEKLFLRFSVRKVVIIVKTDLA